MQTEKQLNKLLHVFASSNLKALEQGASWPHFVNLPNLKHTKQKQQWYLQIEGFRKHLPLYQEHVGNFDISLEQVVMDMYIKPARPTTRN